MLSVLYSGIMRTFPEAPDFYFSLPALEAAEAAGAIALDATVEGPDGLQAMLDYVEERSGKALAGRLTNTSFVIMRGDRDPRLSEGHYFQASPDYPFLPSDQLGQPPHEWTPKDDLTNRNVLEIRPRLWHGSLAPYIAIAVMGPPPEDHALNAGIGAWGRQFIDAFTLPDTKKHQIEAEVSRRFPGAVVLRRAIEPDTPAAA